MPEESKPLAGKSILVTRPESQANELCEALEREGARTIRIPLIRITEPESWQEFDEAAKRIDEFAWIIFASTNAVSSTIERMRKLKVQINKTATKVACIGSATQATLLKYGISADFTPDKFIAETLVEQFPQTAGNKNILWPKTNLGRLLIKEELEKLGWQVMIVESYNTCGPQDLRKTAEQILQLIKTQQLQAITLASSETVQQLKAVLEASNASLSEVLSNVKLVAIGSATENTCRDLFGRCNAVAKQFNTEGLVEAVRESLQ
ncbi:MAG: uroporphyrinogen-III synthase [Candidatus Obscuribacterales bacterium]|jgi:uroporphyrinogen-III synthase|nr:uroporphyrinogen-III synthase [Candidatus Obscuribacterales bacterium]